MSTISIIVAASDNMVIGKDNQIPWRIPTDFKYFKLITDASVVIMGRKCWESLPPRFRPLPNRLNYVITRNENYVADGAIVWHDLEKALEFFKNAENEDEIFVIGGSDIYEAAFKVADSVYITRVMAYVEGDVFLKGFDESQWKLSIASEIKEENGFKFKFEVYDRKTCTE